MLKTAENTDLSQVSLTGVRAIVLMTLLIEAPRSLEDIREYFIKLKIMEPEHSDDILRIDLNTLKSIGCEITRAGAKTNYKYKLLKHPFALKLNKEEIVILQKAYKRIKNRSGIELILRYDALFKKLAEYVDNDEVREMLYGISILKNHNIDFIKELIEDCTRNQILTLMYKNPSAKEASEKNIAAQKVVVQNDNIYLYGFDFGKKQSVVLNLKRIKSIIARFAGAGNIETETTNVRFVLKNPDIVDIGENEQIIETNENGTIIEGKYYNEFFAAQRILSFGSNCTVIEPEDFKQLIIQKLKNMRDVYNG